MADKHPPICDYEGSDYQTSFWESGERDYEDQVEAIALRRLLPKKTMMESSSSRMLELGAGAGRNTQRYTGFSQIVLMDYSTTQLRQAQERLGRSDRYLFVAADIYRLPFAVGSFDASTMIRVLHHIAEPRLALAQVRRTLRPGGFFILEYANKKNLKAIVRYLFRRQSWDPFSLEPVEFVELNFNFHPRAIKSWLEENDFIVQRQLTVSHFRVNILKKTIPLKLLVGLDSLAQLTGGLWQFTPSVFVKAEAAGGLQGPSNKSIFCCPECGGENLVEREDGLFCDDCARFWRIQDGIYDFREPAI